MVAIYEDPLVSGPDRTSAAWPVCRAGEDKEKTDTRSTGSNYRNLGPDRWRTAWWRHDLGHGQRRYLRQARFYAHNSNTARVHYLMDNCQYAISLSLSDLYLNLSAHISAVACAQLGLRDYYVQCCRWNLAYGGAVGFTSCKYLTVVRITGGFIPACPVYFTISALTYIHQFVRNVYDGAAYNYWRHTLCSRRRSLPRVLSSYTNVFKSCISAVAKVWLVIIDLASFSSIVAFADRAEHEPERLNILVENAGMVTLEHEQVEGWERTLHANNPVPGLFAIPITANSVNLGFFCMGLQTGIPAEEAEAMRKEEDRWFAPEAGSRQLVYAAVGTLDDQEKLRGKCIQMPEVVEESGFMISKGVKIVQDKFGERCWIFWLQWIPRSRTFVPYKLSLKLPVFVFTPSGGSNLVQQRLRTALNNQLA
ncbi:hypothetical protein ARMGADRAFT_1040985 [Armillaria gallica]|uniref:Uncharacterized protein n=1 Tax=Armillaria gallica TaxID=47427 RepID=A0A2H3C7X7_ARMGA|nr:hypothetical protein ARMGADRAFT_1040985 [Armillaria gallica]